LFRLARTLDSIPQTGWFNFANEAHMEDVRRRLQAADDNERDGSDSNCSDSVGGGGSGAFRPTGSGSPKDGSKTTSGSSYPSPNISVGPPIQPPPHLLPYLYPHGIYNHVAPPLFNPAMNPGLFLNAQLALAAQHPALFGHYSGHSPTSPLHNLKTHRFSPYHLPGFHQGSAFDAVTPGQSNTNSERPPERSLSSSPSQNPNVNSDSPSASPTPSGQARPSSQQSSSAFSPQVPTANSNSDRSKNGNGINNSTTVHKNSTASELKNMEKMVNGLEMHQNGNTVPTSLASSGSVRSRSMSPDDQSKKVINLTDQ
jgi:T-box protein 2